MAGTALTTRFMMDTATLMLGPMASLYDLLPSTNSVGLVKNVTVSSEPTFADLMQGSPQSTVFSKKTGEAVKCASEVFEYTVQNIGYALGLDGSTFTTKVHAPYTLASPLTGGETIVPLTSISGLVTGDTVMLVDASADDRALVRTITATDGTGVTFTANHAITGAWSTANTKIYEVNAVPVGSTITQPFLSCKIAGQLADGTPLVVLLAKVRITKGFSMAFNSEQFQNMPFEMEVLDLVPTDTFYADFPNRKGTLNIQ
jgi:hypothetical protein